VARPQRPWFRVYVEMIRDKKLRRLTPAQCWLWVVIMACARESPRPGYLMLSEKVPLSWQDVADAAGMRARDVTAGVEVMSSLEMIELDPDSGAWFLPRWNDRQFESDDVTSRTRKNRSQEQDGNVPNQFPGTPQSVSVSEPLKEETESENSEPFEADFNECWRNYPNRTSSRKTALRAYQARRRAKVEADDLLKATMHFAEAMLLGRRPVDKIMHASRFFGANEEWCPYVAGVPGGAAPTAGFRDPVLS
jgi:hypothetical protein